MFTSYEIILQIEQLVYKEVSQICGNSDIDDYFKDFFLDSESTLELKQRLSSSNQETFSFKDLSNFIDNYVERISKEVLQRIRNIPSLTVDNFLKQVKKEVFEYILSRSDLTSDELEKLYYKSENYEAVVADANKWADENKIIKSDILDTLIAAAVDGIINGISY